eukprot:gene5796-4146_t
MMIQYTGSLLLLRYLLLPPLTSSFYLLLHLYPLIFSSFAEVFCISQLIYQDYRDYYFITQAEKKKKELTTRPTQPGPPPILPSHLSVDSGGQPNTSPAMPPEFIAAGPMMEAGLVYGQKVLEQEIHKRKESILPFYDRLRVYFCVDHAYVVAKLGMLIFPFYPKRNTQLLQIVSGAGSGSSTPAPFHMGGSDGAFGSPMATPRPPQSPSSEKDHPALSAPRYLIPQFNCLAFDLYIPLMGLVTYLILSAFAMGLTQDRSLGSEFFLVIMRSMAIRLVLEILCVVGVTMLKSLLVPKDLAILDIVAMMSYKYVLLSFSTLFFLLFGSTCSGQISLGASLYILLSIGFYTSKMLGGKILVSKCQMQLEQQQAAKLSGGVGSVGVNNGSTGHTTKVAHAGALLIALFQIPSVLWGVTNPFSLVDLVGKLGLAVQSKGEKDKFLSVCFHCSDETNGGKKFELFKRFMTNELIFFLPLNTLSTASFLLLLSSCEFERHSSQDKSQKKRGARKMETFQLSIAADYASDFYNVPIETIGTRKFSIYVTLQGQLHHFSWTPMMKEPATDQKAERRLIPFQEKVTLPWNPHDSKFDNKMGVELWCKRKPFFKDCVAVEWIDLDRVPLERLRPIKLKLHGSFERRRASMVVVLTALNFSALPPSMLSNQHHFQASSTYRQMESSSLSQSSNTISNANRNDTASSGDPSRLVGDPCGGPARGVGGGNRACLYPPGNVRYADPSFGVDMGGAPQPSGSNHFYSPYVGGRADRQPEATGVNYMAPSPGALPPPEWESPQGGLVYGEVVQVYSGSENPGAAPNDSRHLGYYPGYGRRPLYDTTAQEDELLPPPLYGSRYHVLVKAFRNGMQWYTRGRQPVAVLDPTTRNKITHSHFYMTTVAHKPLLWVAEQLIELPYVGGITGSLGKVEPFLALLFRMLQIAPAPPLIFAMLRQNVHKYLRVAAMVYLRLLGTNSMIQEAREVGLQDYRKIRVYGYVLTSAPGEAASLNLSHLSNPSISSISQREMQKQRCLFSGKRPRSETSEAFDQPSSTALSPQPTDGAAETEAEYEVQYYITHVDEIAEHLFGVGTIKGPSSMHFLGIPLPSLEYMHQAPLDEGWGGDDVLSNEAIAQFINLENLLGVWNEATLIAGLGLFLVVVLVFTGSTKKSRSRIAGFLHRRKPPVLHRLPCAGIMFFMICGVILIALNAVFSLMRNVALREGETIDFDVQSLEWWEIELPCALFLTQWFALLGLWACIWAGNAKDEYAVVAVILHFLPSFFDSTSLIDEKIQLTAVWAKHLVFGQSLLLGFAFWFPYFCREIGKAKKQIEGSTVGILEKRKDELAELLTNTNSPQQTYYSARTAPTRVAFHFIRIDFSQTRNMHRESDPGIQSHNLMRAAPARATSVENLADCRPYTRLRVAAFNWMQKSRARAKMGPICTFYSTGPFLTNAAVRLPTEKQKKTNPAGLQPFKLPATGPSFDQYKTCKVSPCGS